MWMTDYIRAIKREFRDKFNFIPSGGTKDDPTFDNIPDGEYDVFIEGKKDTVKIINGGIHCCNFE